MSQVVKGKKAFGQEFLAVSQKKDRAGKSPQISSVPLVPNFILVLS